MSTGPKLSAAGSRAALSYAEVGAAMLVHAGAEAAPDVRRFAAGLPADPGHRVVVVDVPPSSPVRLWAGVAGRLAEQPGTLRLVPGRPGQTSTAQVARWLTARLDRPVLAYEGAGLQTYAGTLFVPPEAGRGWLRFEKGRRPQPYSRRFPSAPWECPELGEERLLDPEILVEPLPAGAWIRPAGSTPAAQTYRKWLHAGLGWSGLRPRVVVGYPGAEPVPVEAVAAFWRSLPEPVRAAVRFAQFGPAAAGSTGPEPGPAGVGAPESAAAGPGAAGLGAARPGVAGSGALGPGGRGRAVSVGAQALADLLDSPVAVGAGVRIAVPAGPGPRETRTLLPDGVMSWTPFAAEFGYLPRSRTGGVASAPVLLDRVRPPVPGLAETAPGVYGYAEDAVLEVTQSGLWLRPPGRPATSVAIRSVPADPQQAKVFYDDSSPGVAERMNALALDAVQRLEPEVRESVRVLPVSSVQAARSARRRPEIDRVSGPAYVPAHAAAPVAEVEVEGEGVGAVAEHGVATASASATTAAAAAAATASASAAATIATTTAEAGPGIGSEPQPGSMGLTTGPTSAPAVSGRTRDQASAGSADPAADPGARTPGLGFEPGPASGAQAQAEGPGGVIGSASGSVTGSASGRVTASAAGSASGSAVGLTIGPASGSASGPVAGPVIGPASGSAAGPAIGSVIGPAAGPVAGPAIGPAGGPVTESVAGSASGAAAGSVIGPAIGPVTGPAIGPAVGSVAGLTIGSAAGPVIGPVAGPAIGPASGLAAGSASGPVIGPVTEPAIAPASGSAAGSVIGSVIEPAAGSVTGPAAGPAVGPAAESAAPGPGSFTRPRIRLESGPEFGPTDPPPQARPPLAGAGVGAGIGTGVGIESGAGAGIETGPGPGPGIGPLAGLDPAGDGSAPATAGAPSAADPGAHPPRPAADPVRVQPVPVPAACAIPPTRGLVQERQWLRRTFSRQYDADAGSVARVLSESPGLRGGSTSVSVEVLTDLVAVRLYLSGRSRGIDDAVRGGGVGPHVPIARCIASGLRRLPSHRGPALLCADLEPAQWEWYRGREIVTEWACCPALTGPRLQLPGEVDFLLWSMTARRTELVDPDLPDQVVFLPGTSFKVLRTDEGRRRRVLLRELTGAEVGPDGRIVPGHEALDEMAGRELDQAADAWRRAEQGRPVPDRLAERYSSPPGLVVGPRTTPKPNRPETDS